MADLGSENSEPKANPSKVVQNWIIAVPFFLSAAFFLSGFLLIFAPLPLVFLSLKMGRRWAVLACITNAAIVGFLGGVFSLALYLALVIVLSLALSETLLRKKSVGKSAIYTLLTMALSGLVMMFVYSQLHHLNLFQEMDAQVNRFVDYLGKSVSVGSGLVNPADLDEWKKNLILEFPSVIAIFALVMVWANLVIVIRSSLARTQLGVDPSILKKWKAPEFLVWPTIVSGFFLVVDFGIASDVALNVFRFLMAIYAIQGLSILNFLFDFWGIKGLFRLAGYSLSLFLMMPLVLSLGFFDLWFDFRGKFRQS